MADYEDKKDYINDANVAVEEARDDDVAVDVHTGIRDGLRRQSELSSLVLLLSSGYF